jgi:hypothetical protein
MGNCLPSRLTDAPLIRDPKALVTRDRATTAELLAYLGEVDARKLYAPAAYPSMFAYTAERTFGLEFMRRKREPRLAAVPTAC